MKPIARMGIGELAAFVSSHLKRNGIEVVLSGGGCVAVYSDDRYVSYDLDFVENLGSSRRRLKQVLEMIDFAAEGRYFKHPATDFFLEFPAGPLALGDEPPQQVVVLQYETGELTALSPTDCVKDRLAAYFHWNDRECLEQTLLVTAVREVDLAEVERWAFKEGHAEKFLHYLKMLKSHIEK